MKTTHPGGRYDSIDDKSDRVHDVENNFDKFCFSTVKTQTKCYQQIQDQCLSRKTRVILSKGSSMQSVESFIAHQYLNPYSLRVVYIVRDQCDRFRFLLSQSGAKYKHVTPERRMCQRVVKDTQTYRQLRGKHPQSFLLVSYGHLVKSPRDVVRRIRRFLARSPDTGVITI